MDPVDVATGGGTAGLIIALGYVGKMALDYLRGRRIATAGKTSAAVVDMSTANAALLRTLDKETARADRAEERERTKDERIRQLESELTEVRDQLADMTRRVADMSIRLRDLHDDTPA